MSLLRLGTVPYLNAAPLLGGLDAEDDVQLVHAVPSELAPRLRAGDLDAALVSAVELFRGDRLGWVEGPAITSRGPVESILLFLRTDPADVRTLALDRSSLSAAAMTQVCLRTFLGAGPLDVSSHAPDGPLDAVDADAVLRIGDPALRTDPGARTVLDMGRVWTDATGLPFVYALWLTRAGVPEQPLASILARARTRGLADRPQLAARFAADEGMDETRCLRYLRDRIGYDLGADERAGLARFGELARSCGLVDRAELPDPIRA